MALSRAGKPVYGNKIRKFWITTPQVSGEVNVNARGQICETPPVWKRFLGQSLYALTGWLKNNGTVEIENLTEGEKDK